MKLKCDFCPATAHGTHDSLTLAGWLQVILSHPVRVTVAACPAHHREWSDRVTEIFAGTGAGGTMVRGLAEDTAARTEVI